MKILARINKYLISAKSKYYGYSNKLVIDKMKGETVGVVIKTFVGLKSKIYLLCIQRLWVQIQLQSLKLQILHLC